jgi:predicted amidohydrolase YtcJ
MRRIFGNARVYTADATGSWAEAVGVSDGRIVAVGTHAAVRGAMPQGTEELDLGGRTVLPGLIDGHQHFVATAETMSWIDLRYPAVASIEQMLLILSEAAARTPAGRWIKAFNLDPPKLAEGRWPGREDLDEATSDHPVLIQHVSGHHVLLNSAALAQRSITDDVRPPKGGDFGREPDGRLNGWCLDAATSLAVPLAVDVRNHAPNIHFDTPLEELVTAVDAAGHRYLECGLTAVCDAQVTRRELGVYQEAKRRGRLHVRTVCMPLSHQLAAFEELALHGPFGDDHLRLGPMKFYSDGSIIGGTAAFREPYGPRRQWRGSLYWEASELAGLISRAHADGWQAGIHAVGDRGIEIALDAIEAALRSGPDAERRHRIEHAIYPTEAEQRRMAELGVVAVSQPLFLHDFGDDFLAGLGDRGPGLLPLRSELERGIPVVLSSDSSVASFRPLSIVAAATSRRTRKGEVIAPSEVLSIEQAVRAYTIEAARAVFAEDSLGSLEAGKAADLVVIDGDLFGSTPDRVAELSVYMTVLAGETVYSAV